MPQLDTPASIRTALGITQEQMARLLGVSFVSVNRWEGGHSAPAAATQDLYSALASALRAGATPASILKASTKDRGVFLYTLFRMAYGPGSRALR